MQLYGILSSGMLGCDMSKMLVDGAKSSPPFAALRVWHLYCSLIIGFRLCRKPAGWNFRRLFVTTMVVLCLRVLPLDLLGPSAVESQRLGGCWCRLPFFNV